MKLSPFKAKWLINLYPPFLLNRIFVKYVSDDFRRADIKIKKSWLNKNLQGTIFGGTLYSAADPYPALLYWQIFAQKGIKTEAWLKKAEVEYHMPANSDITISYEISEQNIVEAEEALKDTGRFSTWHEAQAIDKSGDVCVTFRSQIVMKLR
jgi:hypothetical protein